MTTISKYRIYCIEESTFVELWSEIEPTLCPNNHADRTIDSSQTVIIESREATETKVLEPTSGSYQYRSLENDIPAGNTGAISSFTHIFPMDISIWTLDMFSHEDNIGDRITATVLPDKIVGTLTSTGTTGSTLLNVSETVVSNDLIIRGIYVDLYHPPSTSEKLGRVISFYNAGATGSTITVENELTTEFPPGSFVRFNLRMIDDILLWKPNASHYLGLKGFKSKLLNAYYPIRFDYTNNSTNAKKFVVYCEYYYS